MPHCCKRCHQRRRLQSLAARHHHHLWIPRCAAFVPGRGEIGLLSGNSGCVLGMHDTHCQFSVLSRLEFHCIMQHDHACSLRVRKIISKSFWHRLILTWRSLSNLHVGSCRQRRIQLVSLRVSQNRTPTLRDNCLSSLNLPPVILPGQRGV